MNPDAKTIDELERRLGVMEKRQRWLARGAIAALLLSAFLLLVQMLETIVPPPATIEAEAFVLRDLDGVVRARLSQQAERPPELLLADAQGRVRMRLALAPDGLPSLMMRDDRGHLRAGLALLPDQRPQLALVGKHGTAKVALSVKREAEDGQSGGAGQVTLRDSSGEKVFVAP